MTKTELAIVRSAIAHAKGETAAADVKAILQGKLKIYMSTWVIGALERLLPENRPRRLKQTHG